MHVVRYLVSLPYCCYCFLTIAVDVGLGSLLLRAFHVIFWVSYVADSFGFLIRSEMVITCLIAIISKWRNNSRLSLFSRTTWRYV